MVSMTTAQQNDLSVLLSTIGEIAILANQTGGLSTVISNYSGLANTTGNYVSQISSLNGQLVTASGQIVSLQSSNASLTTVNSGLNSQVSSLKTQIVGLNSEITSLEAQLSGVNVQPTGTSGTSPTGVTPSGVTVPSQASAAGFHNLIFNDDFTSDTVTLGSATNGFNWYPSFWAPATKATVNTGAGTGALAGANGILNVVGGNVETMPPNSAPGTTAGSWEHGYFEARIQFNSTPDDPSAATWPGFWAWGTNFFATNPATHPATLVSELDFFEAYPLSSTTFDPINTIHTWNYPANSYNDSDIANTDNENQMMSLQGSSESPSPTDGAWHTYGGLWVSTGTGTGYIEFYYDNKLVVHAGGVTRFATGTGSKLTAQEIQSMFLLLQGGPNQPINVDWVHVWQ